MSWYVLYTNPRSEAKVAERLEALDFKIFCPMITEIRQWSDRKKKVRTPLFKGFIFLKSDEKNRQRVFEVPGVVRFMYWLGKPALVRDSEIDVIKSWLDDDQVDSIEIDNINVGDKLTISDGAFKNQEAVVRDVGKTRLRLVLPKLGYTVSVKIKEVL